MSKLLKRLNDNQNKVADTNGIMKLQAWDYGVVQDLTNKKITATVANASGFLFDIDLVSNGTEIDLDFKDSQLQKLPPDTYFLEIKVTEADGDISVFPTEGYATFTINKNLHATEGALVPQITFDTVLTDVKTAMDEKVADYVKTIAKGDKGDKGDTPDITVGGRNLVLGTSKQVVQATNWNMQVADIKYDKSLGKTICASVMINNADHASALGKGSASIILETLDQSGQVLSKIQGKSVLYNADGLSWVSTTLDENTASVRVRIWTNNMNRNAFYSRLKVERGNVATDWTPAPEDVDSSIETAQSTADNASTDIKALKDHTIRDNVSGQSVQGDLTVGHIMEADSLYKHVPSAGATPFLEMNDTNLNIKQAIGHYYSAFTHGSGVTLGAGGLTIVGGGESAKGLGDAINDGLADTSASGLPISDHGKEHTIIASDGYIYFMPGQQAGYPTLGPAFRFSSGGYLDKYTGSGWTPLITPTSTLLAQDSQVVHNTNNETVAGNKTFSGNTTMGGTLMTDSGWKNLSSPSGSVKYRILNGVVHLSVLSAREEVGSAIATLPVGARPGQDVWTPYYSGGISGNYKIQPDGKIYRASESSSLNGGESSMLAAFPID